MKPCEPFLSVCLSVSYPSKPDVLRGAFLQMRPGDILGLVGHSGSGKSTIALSILRLLNLKGGTASGTVYFRGRDLMQADEREMRCVRGKEIGLVLQSPLSSLNPVLRIGTQLAEAWNAHASGSREACRAAICDTLNEVSLPSDLAFLKRFPSQLSVGQAQRVLIAIAVLHRPALLVADEPTSALDPITQSEVLALFSDLNRSMGMAILYISHDLLSVASICDRIAILYDGEIVETGPTEEIFRRPAHPYTHDLISALPGVPECLRSRRRNDLFARSLRS